MAEVIWSPAALQDVDAIAEYIARDSPEQAALLVGRLLHATDRLAQFPESGRIIPEIEHPACREIVVGAYRVMYRLEGAVVWITGVVHGAQRRTVI